MTIPTGETSGEARSQSNWSLEITVSFVQVPREKEDAYWSALEWIANQIRAEMMKEAVPNEQLGTAQDGRQLAVAVEEV